MSSVAVSVAFGVFEVIVLLAVLRFVILGGPPRGASELKEKVSSLELRVAMLEAAAARAEAEQPVRPRIRP